MKVRVIAGRYGGRWLDAPDNRRTHPMGERVRNALFNSLGDAVQDARVLDVFAGTGAVGLEALSRGAHQVVLHIKCIHPLHCSQKDCLQTELLSLSYPLGRWAGVCKTGSAHRGGHAKLEENMRCKDAFRPPVFPVFVDGIEPRRPMDEVLI